MSTIYRTLHNAYPVTIFAILMSIWISGGHAHGLASSQAVHLWQQESIPANSKNPMTCTAEKLNFLTPESCTQAEGERQHKNDSADSAESVGDSTPKLSLEKSTVNENTWF